ncbi:hypothetical protein A3L11_07545 [Thermococcus siculi]|uniref:Uncharacterized protein n=1 Tax=Thermococcus siculi TaxID=72803 RepID=A0A2Z2ML45_9EURY|nr:hypothetical protein [Thermococcus siculi]ASJ09089.1 hypothetical protein A3L11_07545 [Thermococcus siculi]
MESKTVLYWLLITLSFALTQPGAITFANWDAPYGFYKDLSVWLSCAGAALVLVFIYGLHLWRRGELGVPSLIATVPLIAGTFWLAYWTEGFIRGEMGYGTTGIAGFIVGAFIGLLLSLLLLPMALPRALTGELYYPYDGPLVLAWYFLLGVAVLLSVALYLQKKREKLREPDNPAP